MSSKPFGSSRKKDIFDKEKCLFFIDINLLRDFRYVKINSICADAHDMLPYGNEIYIISSFEQSEKHIDFVKTRISSNRRLHIDENISIFMVVLYQIKKMSDWTSFLFDFDLIICYINYEVFINERILKKIDKSFFKYGITIPKDRVEDFLCNKPLLPGENRKINVRWKKNTYSAHIYHVNRKQGTVYQIRWDSDKKLISELKQEFIQSYFAIESQNFEAKEKHEYHITNLLGGSQEVVIFKIIDENSIELDTFIKIQTSYDNVFKRLVEQNVFGWLSNAKYKDQLITKITKWYDINDLHRHEDVNHVIYYLVDDNKKEIYMGSAKRLGDRVKPNRQEIPGWNKFRYEIVSPEYHDFLRMIEYHSIMDFATFFKNSRNLTSLKLSEYTLVNKDYKYYQK